MDYTQELYGKRKVACGIAGEPAPIPQDGKFTKVKEQNQLSGFSHSVGTCGLKQGACKLSLNVKEGIIQEALIEGIGCSGMTQSGAMAAEILPGKTLLEALNTDLVCDAINVAMREFLLAMAYGRTQTAYSEGGLAVGAAMEDLGKGFCSQVGTSYGTVMKGPRYLELTEGYVRRIALDERDEIIRYEYVNTGRMMEYIDEGYSPEKALELSTGQSSRFSEGVTIINPRKE